MTHGSASAGTRPSTARTGTAVVPDGAPAWHTLEVAEVVTRLGGDPTRGLGRAEAARRLASVGPNELDAAIVNNARFLILPWVRCHNLASRLLAITTRRLAEDWHQRHGYRPVLLETFVESPRFKGTCYKAANWICVGETDGRGKRDVQHQRALPTKLVWLQPLTADFRNALCAAE